MSEGPAPFADAILAADLLAISPAALGGARVAAGPGAARDAWLAALAARLPPGMPLRKIPAHVSADRLIGGLALAETLRRGAPVLERGLLGTVDGGIALLAMAERLPAAALAPLLAALDRGEVAMAREGITARIPARIAVVALDEGSAPDERLADALADRLAFDLALDGIAGSDAVAPPPDPPRLAEARRRLPAVRAGDDSLAAITELAFVLGIASLRAPLFALAACRALAALDGRAEIDKGDVAAAVRLVLAPRATRLPAAPEDPAPDDADTAADDAAPETRADGDPSDGTPAPPGEAGGERLVEAALAALPDHILDGLARRLSRAPASGSRGAGTAHAARLRGRPTGVRAGRPRAPARLSVLDTIKAAAPWQPVRRRERGDAAGLFVRPDDFRVRTFKDRRESVTVFAVDVSGSMAAARLAEAKGAIELLLSRSYNRRDHVALIAFAGTGADLVVPPTRSLTRVKRLVAGLPGGGGTPLAAALDAARHLCEDIARKGRTPTLVILSDGRANIARDGAPDRAAARADAAAAARRLAAAAIATLLIDTARRPGGRDGRAIADAAAARYVWLPVVDAQSILAASR